MIEGVINVVAIVVAVFVLVIFPWVYSARGRTAAQGEGAPARSKGSRWVMAGIGAVCAALYYLMFLELSGHVRDTALRVVATVLLALPSGLLFIALVTLYHGYLWLRDRARRD